MADNSEIIVGGGQAITPDQATIDELVEKLRQKLIAREMDPDRIQQLCDKYRNYLPSWLTLTHKYITLYPLPTGNADYNRDYDTIYTDNPVFEEVNWSAVDYPEERPDEYRLSRRLSNMYHHKTHIDNPPMYKFEDIDESVTEEELHWVFNEETGEYEQVPRDMVYKADATGIIDRYDQSTSFRLATYNHNDDIRKIFFLEIIWGYSGWEWHDYERVIGTDPDTEEPITETLKGGNLYKIKDIKTVPHIIDGHRLQHINDFLFSQYNVTRVEGFNTSNLVAANRAFKRGTNEDTNYPKRLLADTVNCHFVDGQDEQGNFNHPFGYADPVTGESLLENLVEADGLFYNNKVYMYEGDFLNAIPFTIPNIKSIDRLYAYGFYTEGLKFKFDNLEKLTRPFMGACFYINPVNINSIFVGNTLKKVTDLSYLLAGVSFVGYDLDSNLTMNVSLDLTSSIIDSSGVIDLSHFVEYAGTEENRNVNTSAAVDSKISIDLNFNNKVNLDYAFRYLIGNKLYPNAFKYGDDNNLYHRIGSFQMLDLDFNDKWSYITSIREGLSYNTFIEALPIQQVPNNSCDDSYIYKGSIFNVPISYNFLNGSIVSPREQGYGQFNDCTINDSYTFSNIQGLDRVEFCGIKFGDNVLAADKVFPYVVQNQNDTTYRYFDMANSKFVGTLSAQNIYIDSERMRNATDKYSGAGYRLNPFQGCSELTDLSNISLYYSDNDGDFDNMNFDFSNCINLIKTPHVYFKHVGSPYVYAYIYFQGLKNLTEVNFENLSFRGDSPDYAAQNFQDCTSLVYLKIATNTTDGFDANLDVRGCTNIDADTLKSTLLMIKSGNVQILDSTWKKVNGISPSAPGDVDSGPVYDYFIAQSIGCAVTKDASYTPVYPD